MKARTILSALALPLVTVVALAGCASTPSQTTSTSGSSTISVVASTNVYGDIAKSIGGSAVKVTSIMSDPAQDPHSFEASAQNQLELANAKVVIENGGGYDPFVGTMLASAKNTSATVLDAVKLSGLKPDASGDLNEHVWYNFPVMKTVADKLVATLSSIDPTNASTFQANATAFEAKLTTLEAQEASLKAKFAGQGVSITEPVPVYMLDAIGLVDKTPFAFSKAIEDGTDVSPTVLQQTLALYSSHSVKLLAYNEQTSGPQTDAVLTAAKTAGIPVVPVTETLPSGKDYISWMTSNLNAIAHALGA
ncbi:MAG: zinc/manganese transport system substrate-binding protein [Microbacteriaceae bacterium]|jgi:zinc/manganese transport system substrate-binding protein|nr:zinc/manganese transport system substrate-binding protein [Microbacteriaceae bacterium]